jgi:hypothetical protein
MHIQSQFCFKNVSPPKSNVDSARSQNPFENKKAKASPTISGYQEYKDAFVCQSVHIYFLGCSVFRRPIPMADSSEKNEHDPREEEEEPPPPPTKKSKVTTTTTTTTTTTSATMMTASGGASCEGDSGGVPPADSGGVAVVAIPSSSIRAVVPLPSPPVPPRCKLCQTRPVVRYNAGWGGPKWDLHYGDTALLLAKGGGRCAQCCSTLRKLLRGHFHFCRHCDDAFPADWDGRAFYDWSDECDRCGNLKRECLVCGYNMQASGYSSTQ